jgi:mono/diheme cytochrome c family protein
MMPNHKITGRPQVLLLATVLAIACFFAVPGRAQNAGQKVYEAKCKSCHAADGSGSTPAGKATKARDFCSEEVRKHTDAEWADIILKGKNKMPGYDKKLTEAEVKDLVAYIRSLCKK